MKLTETLPHSGVFTGTLQPVFIGEKQKPAPAAAPAQRNARAKLVAVLAYTVVLISFGRYTVAGLAPMAAVPRSNRALITVPVLR